MIATSNSADRNNKQRSAHNQKGFIKATEKRPCSDIAHTRPVSAKRRLPVFPGSHNANCAGTMETISRKEKQQPQQQTKNYLLAEFESILTRISKDTFI